LPPFLDARSFFQELDELLFILSIQFFKICLAATPNLSWRSVEHEVASRLSHNLLLKQLRTKPGLLNYGQERADGNWPVAAVHRDGNNIVPGGVLVNDVATLLSTHYKTVRLENAYQLISGKWLHLGVGERHINVIDNRPQTVNRNFLMSVR
jgi:hypothetical protein